MIHKKIYNDSIRLIEEDLHGIICFCQLRWIRSCYSAITFKGFFMKR